MSQSKTLQQLQEIEHEITTVKNRLQEIEQILNSDAAIQQARDHVTQAETDLKPLRMQGKELEHEIDITTTKAKETEDRLYSGAVKNPKEMQDLQQEVNALKTRGARLEEDLLAVMMKTETVETKLENSQEQLEKTIKARTAENEALVLERDAANSKLQALEIRRQQTIEDITPQNLQIYEQLKPRTRGTAVTRMRADGTCSVCGVQQNRTDETEIRRGNLVQCSNCRRILVF